MESLFGKLLGGNITNDERENIFYCEEVVRHFTCVIPKPKGGEWFSEHKEDINFKEDGQSFPDYQISKSANKVTISKNVIYVLPIKYALTTMNEDEAHVEVDIQPFQRLVEVFYQMKVVILGEKTIEKEDVETRMNCGKLQLKTTDILDLMEKLLPEDAYCMLSFTSIDLFPLHSRNFVFGHARLSRRVGVFSFARYDPDFFNNSGISINDRIHKITERAIKVMLHEIGHMFGIKHCIYFNCLISGSNHMGEIDRRMPFYCPICLKKLQSCLQLSPQAMLERYQSLQTIFNSLLGENHSYSKWLSDHLSIIEPKFALYSPSSMI